MIEPLVFEGIVEYDAEDGGQALIATIYDAVSDTKDMFVRVQSWDETTQHVEAKRFDGKKVRVTVEVVE